MKDVFILSTEVELREENKHPPVAAAPPVVGVVRVKGRCLIVVSVQMKSC